MIKPDVQNNVLFNHYRTADRKTVIKLLLRCDRLYNARNDVITILKLISELEALFKKDFHIQRLL